MGVSLLNMTSHDNSLTNTESPENWRTRCKNLSLDPQEVKSVSSRFDMYRSYTEQQGAEVLDLPRWYKWYRVEKLSEGHAMQSPPEQGCSVGPETEAQGPVISEQDFLILLKAYRAARK
jgi:hypothetical protein